MNFWRSSRARECRNGHKPRWGHLRCVPLYRFCPHSLMHAWTAKTHLISTTVLASWWGSQSRRLMLRTLFTLLNTVGLESLTHNTMPPRSAYRLICLSLRSCRLMRVSLPSCGMKCVGRSLILKGFPRPTSTEQSLKLRRTAKDVNLAKLSAKPRAAN